MRKKDMVLAAKKIQEAYDKLLTLQSKERYWREKLLRIDSLGKLKFSVLTPEEKVILQQERESARLSKADCTKQVIAQHHIIEGCLIDIIHT